MMDELHKYLTLSKYSGLLSLYQRHQNNKKRKHGLFHSLNYITDTIATFRGLMVITVITLL